MVRRLPPGQPTQSYAISELNVADGTLSKLAEGGRYRGPKYSPDGGMVGFVHCRDHFAGVHTSDLMHMDLATGRMYLVAQKVNDWCWGRDSYEVLLARGNAVYRRDVPTGEEELLLTAAEFKRITTLFRSPDGSGFAVSDGRSLRVKSDWGEMSLDCTAPQYGFDWGESGLCYLSCSSRRSSQVGLYVHDPATDVKTLIAVGPFGFVRWAGKDRIAVICRNDRIRLYDLKGGYVELLSLDGYWESQAAELAATTGPSASEEE